MAGVNRRLSNPFTLGGSIGFVVMTLAFVAIAIAPTMREATHSWLSWKSWTAAFSAGWLALIAALYLKLSERFGRHRTQGKEFRKRRRYASMSLNRGIIEIAEATKANKTDWEDLRSERAKVLASAAAAAKNLLNLGEKEQFVATLVDFSTGDTGIMRVVARSTSDREVGIEYPIDRMLAWDAIRNGDAAVLDDIKDDLRWQNVGERQYRSVIAFPLVRDGKAFGALGLDSEIAYAFYGTKKELAVELQPYLAVLLLTYPTESVSCVCTYDPTHYKTT